MKCIKVKKKDAEKTKQKLIVLGVLAKGFKPFSGRDYLYFPVNEEVKDYEICNKNFEKILDLGCASGFMTNKIAQIFPKSEIN